LTFAKNDPRPNRLVALDIVKRNQIDLESEFWRSSCSGPPAEEAGIGQFRLVIRGGAGRRAADPVIVNGSRRNTIGAMATRLRIGAAAFLDHSPVEEYPDAAAQVSESGDGVSNRHATMSSRESRAYRGERQVPVSGDQKDRSIAGQ